MMIDVKAPTISVLVEDLMSGKYRLPSFQRRYEWDEDDIRDLIDSLVKGYPIGAIILWKPSSLDIDPFSVPLIDVESNPAKEAYYVVDGQQRLTSLLLLLNNWSIRRGGRQISRDPITYNPANKRFYKSRRLGIDLSKLIGAFYRYDDSAMTELRRTTRQQVYDDMKEMIAGLLLKYRLPEYIMETDHEDEQSFRDMAEAFIRVNRYGLRIGNLELMLSFLAGAVGGNLKERVRDLYDGVATFGVELQPIIRFAFGNLGLKQTQVSRVEQFKANIQRISQYDDASRGEVLDRCETALRLSVELLRERLGIGTAALLPSQTALIPIAQHLFNTRASRLGDLDPEDVQKMVRWFVLASFNGYYSSMTDTKLDRDLEALQGPSFALETLLGNMQERRAKVRIGVEDVRKGLSVNVLRAQGRAYLFLLYILLVRNEADDWNGVLLRERDFSELAKHHIFPTEFLEQQELGSSEPDQQEIETNNVANITFIHKDINSEIGASAPETYLRQYSAAAGKHFVPTDGSLWSIDQYGTFQEYRATEIYRAGKRYLGEIFD